MEYNSLRPVLGGKYDNYKRTSANEPGMMTEEGFIQIKKRDTSGKKKQEYQILPTNVEASHGGIATQAPHSNSQSMPTDGRYISQVNTMPIGSNNIHSHVSQNM